MVASTAVIGGRQSSFLHVEETYISERGKRVVHSKIVCAGSVLALVYIVLYSPTCRTMNSVLGIRASEFTIRKISMSNNLDELPSMSMTPAASDICLPIYIKRVQRDHRAHEPPSVFTLYTDIPTAGSNRFFIWQFSASCTQAYQYFKRVILYNLFIFFYIYLTEVKSLMIRLWNFCRSKYKVDSNYFENRISSRR